MNKPTCKQLLLANLPQEKKMNMLLSGLRSVRIGKNCDLGFENAALGQHFQDLGHSFSLYGPPSRPITYVYYVACSVSGQDESNPAL